MAENPTHENDLKDFFISYAHQDWDWAKWINQQLVESGYSTILPDRDFLPGRNFILEMDRATQAKRTIAVLSPDYLKSKFTQLEWTAALCLDPTGLHGLLLPVRVRSCDIQGILALIIYIDLLGQDHEKARKSLLAGVQQSPKKLKPASFPSPQITKEADALSSRFGAAFPDYWNVSRRHAPYFTGRDDQIRQVFENFITKDTTQLVLPQALVGLGGLGKTQTAAEYAYRYRGEYEAVLWARAETTETLTIDFQSFTRLLKLPSQDDPIEMMQKWFTEHSRWLLILDNADDLELVAPFFPRSPRGHILLTTRARATGNIAESFLLEPLNPEDGALCILRRAGGKISPLAMDAAINLSQLMDGLPLALEQAGAYIEDTGSSASRYLGLYKQRRAEIIERHYGALPNYPLPVATAWQFSKEVVKQKKPAAFELLQFCAFLAPEAIPEEIFIKGASALGEVLGPIAAYSIALDVVTSFLRERSLLNREVDRSIDIDKFSIHRMMQEILRDEMDEETQKSWAERAVRAISLGLPSVERQAIEVHARNCIPLIEQWKMTFPEAEQVQQYVAQTRDG